MGPLTNCPFDICNTWRQSLFHDFKSSVCSADIEASGDENAESLRTRQRVTGTQIADVWDEEKKKRNHSAGCIGLCTAINKAACMRGWTNSAVNPLESAGRAWEQAKWAIDTTPTSWPAASRLVLSRRWLWSAAPKLVRRSGPPSQHSSTTCRCIQVFNASFSEGGQTTVKKKQLI